MRELVAIVCGIALVLAFRRAKGTAATSAPAPAASSPSADAAAAPQPSQGASGAAPAVGVSVDPGFNISSGAPVVDLSQLATSPAKLPTKSTTFTTNQSAPALVAKPGLGTTKIPEVDPRVVSLPTVAVKPPPRPAPAAPPIVGGTGGRPLSVAMLPQAPGARRG